MSATRRGGGDAPVGPGDYYRTPAWATLAGLCGWWPLVTAPRGDRLLILDAGCGG